MILKLTKLFEEFFNSEKTGGIILIACTVLSMVIANSAIGENYVHFWHYKIGLKEAGLNLFHPIEYWINDGLMTVFFLLIGLEIEREVYIGELSNFKNALLPIFAAIGGMLFPALIHLAFNFGTPTQDGIGIPMATDIAFALGVLSILGNRIPVSLKIFLTALAIIDDLGAIIVIAVFYTKSFSLLYLLLALGIFVILLILNRAKVHNLLFYLLPGVLMWYFMMQSGVHATITGVLLAFAIPFGNGDEHSPSYRLQHFLHKPVAFVILPVFALANTGILFSDNWMEGITSSNSLGIISGLSIGKPLGIFLFTFVAVKLGVSSLPEDMNLRQLLGVGILGGIGFTMSIFISLLAFEDPELISNSKMAILASSVFSGIVGYLYFVIGSDSRKIA
jgi:Na+:H+ antiporter, NhaA family